MPVAFSTSGDRPALLPYNIHLAQVRHADHEEVSLKCLEKLCSARGHGEKEQHWFCGCHRNTEVRLNYANVPKLVLQELQK
jgi:hypothetical protein